MNRAKTNRLGFTVTPAEPVVAPKEIEDEARAAQEADNRNYAPDDGIAGNKVSSQRLRRPIAGVRVILAGTVRRRCPCSPSKKGRQATNVVSICDPVGLGAASALGRLKERPVILDHHFVRLGPGRAPAKSIFRFVIGIFVELRGNPIPRGKTAHRRALVTLGEKLRCLVKILGGKIGPQVRTMTIDRPILHQAVALKNIHAAHDVVAGKKCLITCHDPCGQWRLIAVHQISENSQDRKTDQIRHDRALKPSIGDRHHSLCHF